ncbi:DUF7322 domain-containing protein [Halolamina rubra]|uniref:DUF7322 domain-containing protein n=1 Tax=Halolamina rubra TaxID=1380430 RepID=UPI0006790F27|nr:hypothetical protein [Halolamina rubra]
MSDDDPVEAFVEGTVEPFDDADDGYDGPKARDMEAELRERTGSGGGDDVETEVGSETASAFWAAVIYVNAAVLLIALGPVVYALRGRAVVSAVLVAAGLVAFWRAYGVYREFDAEDADDGDDATESDEPADATDTDDDRDED